MFHATFPQFVVIASILCSAAVASCFVFRSRLWTNGIALVAALAVVGSNAELYLRHYSDDAYITLRYSRNLAEGIGPVWNPGEQVEGYTNFSWMLIMAGVYKAGFTDLPHATNIGAYIALAATFAILLRIWALWADDEGDALAHPIVPAIALLLISLNDAVVFWSFSGLETSIAAAALTCTAWFYMRERRDNGAPWSALAAAIGAMTRPEMMAIAALTGGFVLIDAWRMRAREAYLRCITWIALFTITFGSYFAWRWWYYGYPLPNTFYAKVGSNAEFLDRGMGYIQAYGTGYQVLPFLLGAAVLLAAARENVRRDAAYLISVAICWLAVVAIDGGDAFGHGRFIAPILPLVYVAGVSGLALTLGRAIAQPAKVAAVGVAAAALTGLALVRGNADPTIPQDRIAHDNRVALGRWINAHVPPDYTVATYASGAVHYYGQTRGLDMLGLTDETIAHSDVPDFGRGIAGHEKFDIDYVLEVNRPELIAMSDAGDLVLTRERILALPSALPAFAALIDHPRLFELYEPVAAESPRGYLNFLQRKDTLGTISFDWSESGGFVER